MEHVKISGCNERIRISKYKSILTVKVNMRIDKEEIQDKCVFSSLPTYFQEMYFLLFLTVWHSCGGGGWSPV